MVSSMLENQAKNESSFKYSQHSSCMHLWKYSKVPSNVV